MTTSRTEARDTVDVTEIVLMADARVGSIPVQECGEPLLDVAGRARGVVVDARLADEWGDWRQLRAGLVTRLIRAAELLPAELRVLFIEGYRPPKLQSSYFYGYRDELGLSNLGLSADELDRLASRFISPPAVAPHSAGAAMDLTLCDASGRELDLGTVYDANPEESDNACYTGASNISAVARRNRDLLSEVLTRAGFVNYPTEWWHWSFGDRYWALMTGAPAALYGTVERSGS